MLAKTDADAVRVHNRLAVIDGLRRSGAATRKGLSAATGLSLSAASAIASDLLRSGLVVEPGEAEGGRSVKASAARRGRPGRPLALNAKAGRVAAAKIAVGEIVVRLCDYAGATLACAQWTGDISSFSEDEIVSILGRLLHQTEREAMSAHGGSDEITPAVRHITVAVQGKIDSAGTRIVWSPAMRQRDLAIAGPLAKLCEAPVGVFNDCSLLPEAFRWSPDFQGRDFAVLFIGFGVGMGLRLGDATFKGQKSSAVEFGHLIHVPGGALCRCGNRGCVEAYAGDYAIWRRATGLGDEVPASRIPDAEIMRLAALARAGDAAAATAFAEAGTALGFGLGRMFTLVDPLPLVLTGAGAQALDLLEPAIRAGIAQSAVDGDGADIALLRDEDADELIFRAAIVQALGVVDAGFARMGVGAALGSGSTQGRNHDDREQAA